MRKSQLKRNILIVRLSSPGDIVLASPLPKILKKYNPNATIAWAVQPESESLLANNPYIDELFLLDMSKWKDLWKRKRLIQLWKELASLKSDMQKWDFEVAYDLQGLFKSGLITWLSGAKSRVGIGSREGSAVFMHKMISRNIANRDQMGAEYRYLVNQLGYSDSDWNIHIPTSDENRQRATLLLADRKLDSEPYIVVSPFTTREQKQWKDEYWQQLLLRIRGRYQYRTVILGCEYESEAAERLASLCGGVSFAGKTNFLDACEIINRASACIGVDNALTHIAQASNVPSIALFGPSRPYLYSDNESSKVIYKDTYCSPCRRKPICKGDYHCMMEIAPDRVLTELKLLMKTSHQQIHKIRA